MNRAISFVEQGRVPDVLTRIGIRRIVRRRALEEEKRYRDPAAVAAFLQSMSDSPLAVNTTDANDQHYEVPTDFYRLVLGPRLKYSCAWFDSASDTLGAAEDKMLALSAARAGVKDGMRILELGCGWGSLTLYLAERFPNARIKAVSNSATQKAFILEQAQAKSLTNIEVETVDMNDFDTREKFDRIVSIEMFEHMRNHRLLFDRINRWLDDDGKLFLHLFCHRNFPYFFEPRSDADWMAKNFFSGGLMPSFDLPLVVQSTLALENRWAVPGTHYSLTCRRWLEACDRNRVTAISALASGDDPLPAKIQYYRWRMFFMACEELFAYHGGSEWHVGHYLFGKS